MTETQATTNTQALPPLPQGGKPGVMPSGMTQVQATPAAKNIAYANASATQTLDIYLPQGDGPFPLVINVHGGGFMMGDKSNPALTDQLLKAGYAVASVNYRLSGEAKAPAQIEDVKAAVRWLRANAAQYKLNPDKFAAFGQSAGGNLVALLGTSCGVAELEGADLGNADQSSCVQAVVDCSAQRISCKWMRNSPAPAAPPTTTRPIHLNRNCSARRFKACRTRRSRSTRSPMSATRHRRS
jgi:predicted alpha/beta-fold hydrolase